MNLFICIKFLERKKHQYDKKNEFFGFFALTGKATSFVGPLLFGIVSANFSQQFALWIVIFLFLFGTLYFRKINFDEN